MGRFEKEILLEGNNSGMLDNIIRKWIEKIDTVRGINKMVLDMDSSESPVYGEQEESVYNGHSARRLSQGKAETRQCSQR